MFITFVAREVTLKMDHGNVEKIQSVEEVLDYTGKKHNITKIK